MGDLLSILLVYACAIHSGLKLSTGLTSLIMFDDRFIIILRGPYD